MNQDRRRIVSCIGVTVLLILTGVAVWQERLISAISAKNTALRARDSQSDGDTISQTGSPRQYVRTTLDPVQLTINENDRWRHETNEIQKLRQQLVALSVKEDDRIAKIRAEALATRLRVQKGELPANGRGKTLDKAFSLDAIKNQGDATPEALLQTWLWAIQNNKTDWLMAQRAANQKDGSEPPISKMPIEIEKAYFDGVKEVQLADQISTPDETTYALQLVRETTKPDQPTGLNVVLYRVDSGWRIKGVVATISHTEPIK